jgi:hypothetical protein
MGKKKKITSRPQKTATSHKFTFPLFGYLILAAIIILFCFIRIRLASFPLERDEGEYAYFGQLILNGIPPYQLAYNLKFPGIYALYALILAIFGQTTEGIHYGLLLFDLGSLILIYLIMKRLFSSLSALVATAVASIMFLSPDLLGQAAHATHFVTFFMLIGTLLLLKGLEKSRWPIFMLSGVMMGLSLSMKQSGIVFAIFGGVAIIACIRIQKEKRWPELRMPLISYALGVAIPIFTILIAMSICGVFDKFWFWTIIYPKVYSSKVPLSEAWSKFVVGFFPILYSSFAAWIMAALGTIALFLYHGKMRERIILGLLLLFSFVSAIPGFYFREHYFIPMVPAVGMLTGFLLEYMGQRIGHVFRPIRLVFALAIAFLILCNLNENKAFCFQADPEQLCYSIYKGNDFVEAGYIAKYIRENSRQDDRILVFGSEPEIYFYAKRKSATGYIYMYDLAFDHAYKTRMQKELMNETETSKPKFIVFVYNHFSWLNEPGACETLIAWMNSYIQRNKYVPVGLINCRRYPEPSEFFFGKDALSQKAQPPNYIYILQRPD